VSVNAAEQLALVMQHVRHGIVIYDRDERIFLIIRMSAACSAWRTGLSWPVRP
jgi:hypothetical protein